MSLGAPGGFSSKVAPFEPEKVMSQIYTFGKDSMATRNVLVIEAARFVSFVMTESLRHGETVGVYDGNFRRYVFRRALPSALSS
jgi:hypothetical protein